jgi:DNA gyrase subunit A
MVTKKGQVKKTSLKYSKPRINGVAAITIKKVMSLEAKLTNGESQIILAVKSGKLVRLKTKRVQWEEQLLGSWNFER